MWPRQRPAWIWVGLLAFAALAVGIVLFALALEEEERPERRVAERVAVPELTALDYRIASERVERASLVADSYPVEDGAPAGTVVAQEPASGSRVARGTHVRLDVSTGPGRTAPLPVPDLTGADFESALAVAREARFTTRTVERDAPSAEDRDVVLLQEPAAGTRAPALTQITLYVGR